MAIELSLPAKVGAGASAAAAGSLAIAGGAGAFKGNNVTPVTDKEDLKVRDIKENKDSEISESTKEDLDEEDDGETEFVPLEQQETPFPKTIKENNDVYTEQTVGKRFERFLSSTKSTEANNKDWWGKKLSKFQNRANKEAETRESDNPFNTAPTSAFSENLDTENDSLNSKCESIYKKTSTVDELKNESPVSIWDDLWNYCSNLVYSPVTLNERSSLRTTFVGTWGQKLEDKVLSDFHGDNYYLWIFLNDEFFKKQDDEITGEYFQSFKKSNSQNQSANKKFDLKQKCVEAYALSSSDNKGSNSPTEQEILKYCSIEVVS